MMESPFLFWKIEFFADVVVVLNIVQLPTYGTKCTNRKWIEKAKNSICSITPWIIIVIITNMPIYSKFSLKYLKLLKLPGVAIQNLDFQKERFS